MKILSALGGMDMFATAPNIKVKGKDTKFSYCGLLITLLVYALAAALLYAFSFNMFNKTNPAFTQYSQYGGTADSEKFGLSANQFSIEFYMVDSSTNTIYFDESYYSLAAYLVTNGRMKPIEYEFCRDDSGDIIAGKICFSKEQVFVGEDLYLRSNYAAYIQLYYSRCQSDTDIVCATDAEIDSKLGSSFWYTHYTSVSVDPTNYKNPLKRDSKTQSFLITPGYLKYINANMLAIQFASDNGWLLSSMQEESALSLDGFTTEFGGASTNTFFIASMYLTPDKLTYHRQYDKIQDVLARVGSLLSSLTLIFGLLAIPYAKDKIFELLINGYFDVTIQKKRRPVPRSGSQNAKLKPANSPKNRNTSSGTKIPFSPESHTESPLKATSRVENEPIFKKNIELSMQNTQEREKKKEQEMMQAPVLKNHLKEIDETDSLEIVRPLKKDQIPLAKGDKIPSTIDNDFLEKYNAPSKQQKAVNNGNPKSRSIHLDLSPEKNNQEIEVLATNQHQRDDLENEFGLKINAVEGISPTKGPTSLKNIFARDEGEPPTKGPASLKNIKYFAINEGENSPSKPKTKPKPRPLHISYFQWLTSFVSSRPKIKAFNRAKIEISQHIDVLSIVRRFREIDNLKACLFSEQQRALFDNIPKANLIVYLESNGKKEISEEIIGLVESYEGHLDRVSRAYDAVKNCDESSEIEQRLLSLYEAGKNDQEMEE